MNGEKNNDGWILTYTGKKVYPLSMRLIDLDLSDIAHALALTCRFTGQCREFYSVAQHSVLAAEHAWKVSVDKKVALLHDAAEAYLPDIATPLKQHLPEIKKIEDGLQQMIFWRYCSWETLNAAKRNYHSIDDQLIRAEMRALMRNWQESYYGQRPPDFDIEIVPWSPAEAEKRFLAALRQYDVTDQMEDYR